MTLRPHKAKQFLCTEYYCPSFMPFSGNSVQGLFKKRKKMATSKFAVKLKPVKRFRWKGLFLAFDVWEGI